MVVVKMSRIACTTPDSVVVISAQQSTQAGMQSLGTVPDRRSPGPEACTQRGTCMRHRCLHNARALLARLINAPLRTRTRLKASCCVGRLGWTLWGRWTCARPSPRAFQSTHPRRWRLTTPLSRSSQTSWHQRWHRHLQYAADSVTCAAELEHVQPESAAHGVTCWWHIMMMRQSRLLSIHALS